MQVFMFNNYGRASMFALLIAIDMINTVYEIYLYNYILWASKKDFCHLERSYLLLLCGIGYNVVQWSRCELKRDLL